MLQKKVARENVWKFSVFTGVFLKLFTPGFLFSRVKIGVFVHAHFHARFFCRDCSRVTFRFTGAFLRIVHGWVVKVSREKKMVSFTIDPLMTQIFFIIVDPLITQVGLFTVK